MRYLRMARPEDSNLLFAWANDPVTRENSFHTEKITEEAHRNWFRKVMEDPDCYQYLLVDEMDVVGQIRIRVENEIGEVSYSIAPECRGRGYGSSILKLVEEKIRQDAPSVKKLIAKVKLDNPISCRLFENADYDDVFVQYEKAIDGRTVLKACSNN